MLIAEAVPIRRGGGVVAASVFVALLLALLPMPESLQAWRPAFVPLVVIYWCFAAPLRVGVLTAWCAGFTLDLVFSALLGQHALALALAAFLAVKLRARVKLRSSVPLTLCVLALVAVYQGMLLWISSLQGLSPAPMLYWSVPLASMLVWPLLERLLSELQRRYRVN